MKIGYGFILRTSALEVSKFCMQEKHRTAAQTVIGSDPCTFSEDELIDFISTYKIHPDIEENEKDEYEELSCCQFIADIIKEETGLSITCIQTKNGDYAIVRKNKQPWEFTETDRKTSKEDFDAILTSYAREYTHSRIKLSGAEVYDICE